MTGSGQSSGSVPDEDPDKVKLKGQDRSPRDANKGKDSKSYWNGSERQPARRYFMKMLNGWRKVATNGEGRACMNELVAVRLLSSPSCPLGCCPWPPELRRKIGGQDAAAAAQTAAEGRALREARARRGAEAQP